MLVLLHGCAGWDSCVLVQECSIVLVMALLDENERQRACGTLPLLPPPASLAGTAHLAAQQALITSLGLSDREWGPPIASQRVLSRSCKAAECGAVLSPRLDGGRCAGAFGGAGGRSGQRAVGRAREAGARGPPRRAGEVAAHCRMDGSAPARDRDAPPVCLPPAGTAATDRRRLPLSQAIEACVPLRNALFSLSRAAVAVEELPIR